MHIFIGRLVNEFVLIIIIIITLGYIYNFYDYYIIMIICSIPIVLMIHRYLYIEIIH